MELIRLSAPLSGAAAVDAQAPLCPGRKVRLVGVLLTSRAGVAAHASNYKAFQVYGSNGSTVIWEWSTASGADGALVAASIYGLAPDMAPDTAKAFEAAATGALLEYEENEAIYVESALAASGVASDVGITLILRPIS